jgi:hypothetical protein
MAVPYTFGSATTSIPLSQLDSHFATPITLGNTAIQLGNTVTTLNNMTLGNVTISSGTSSIQTNVANATGVLLEANGGTGTTTGYYGFKNRIINGAMVIDQRNVGASVTPTNGQYTLDRWKAEISASSKFSVQQSSTAPTGFNNSLLITSSSAYTVGAADYFAVTQPIEGYNIADFGFGTANAKTVTVSFWVRSSVTGTYSAVLVNQNDTRVYPFTYTINSANTFEQKSVTIVGDTSGTWLTTNGAGIRVNFYIGLGTNFQGSVNAWNSGTVYGASGTTNLVSTNGATFYITGVQLEKGSTATSFDYRPYGTELALCQRYFYQSYPVGSAVGSNVGSDKYYYAAIYTAPSTSAQVTSIPFPVTQRATPTVTFYNRDGTSGQWYFGVFGASEASTSISSTVLSNNAISPKGTSVIASSNIGYGYFASSAEL